MPRVPRNVWGDQAALLGLGNNMSQMAMQIPLTQMQINRYNTEMQYLPQQMEQQAALSQAHQGYYNQAAAFDQAKAAEIQRLATSQQKAGSALKSAFLAQGRNQDATDYLAEAVGFLAQLPDNVRSELVKNYAQTRGLQDPRVSNMMATGAEANPAKYDTGLVDVVTGQSYGGPKNVVLSANQRVAQNVEGATGLAELNPGQQIKLPAQGGQPEQLLAESDWLPGAGSMGNQLSSLMNLYGAVLPTKGKLDPSPLIEPSESALMSLFKGEVPQFVRTMTPRRRGGPFKQPQIGVPVNIKQPDGTVVKATPRNAEELADLMRDLESKRIELAE